MNTTGENVNHSQHEKYFMELVEKAKAGKTNNWPSDDKALIWASEEIAKLRAMVNAK